MNKVYHLYLYSTNYSAENKREVYEGPMGVFSSLEEAEKALAKFCASEKYKYESVDEDFIDNLRVISFQIREEPLNVCSPNCTENIYIYDANGKLVEQQHGRGWSDTTPFKGKIESDCAFHKGDVVYAEIHGNKLCELAVIVRLPLSPDKAAEVNATYEDDVYMVYTSEGEHSCLRPNELYPIVIPLTESKKQIFSLISKVADTCAPESKLENGGLL